MVKKYGSPNVFTEFNPHVSVAFDSVTPDVQNKALMELNLPVDPCFGAG